jgi:hypothetical protein
MLHAYAFSGKKKWVVVALSIKFLGLVGVIIWVMSRELTRLSRRPSLSRPIPDTQRNRSVPYV